jgi:enoyl-CoA hydratase
VLPLDIEHRDGVVTLRLNDPARGNLLSRSLCRALVEAVGDAAADPDARALVVRANGRAFCAGADLEDLKAGARGDTAALHDVYAAFMAVAEAPLPTVAVVEGPAVGAGMNLALACDVRLAGERARFDTRFLQIGLHPGGGHGWMLLRAVGWEQACRLLLLGATVDGAEAQRIGLASACVPDADLDTTLAGLLANLGRVPRDLLLRTKRSLRRAAGQSHEDALRHETEEQSWSLRQPAFADMVSQLQRRLADKGARP